MISKSFHGPPAMRTWSSSSLLSAKLNKLRFNTSPMVDPAEPVLFDSILLRVPTLLSRSSPVTNMAAVLLD